MKPNRGHLNSRKTPGAGKCNDLLQPNDRYVGEWGNVLINEGIAECTHAGAIKIPNSWRKHVMDSHVRSSKILCLLLKRETGRDTDEA